MLRHLERKKILCAFALSSVFLGADCPVQALTLQLPVPGFLRTTYSGAKTIGVPRFDPRLGILDSMTVSYEPEISATISGIATGPANRPNGWSVGLNGKVRLTGPGFGNLDYPFSYPDRSGTLFQPGNSVFEMFGPTVLGGAASFSTGMSAYVGTGTTPVSLSWPDFNPVIFFSRGGTSLPATRDLGATGLGQVTYQYHTTSPIQTPEPGGIALAASFTVTSLFLLRMRWRK